MMPRDTTKRRKNLRMRLILTAAIIVAGIYSIGTEARREEIPHLEIIGRDKVGVDELSGLFLEAHKGAMILWGVGDATAKLVRGEIGADERLGLVATMDLSDLITDRLSICASSNIPVCQKRNGDLVQQFEGIARDGGGSTFLLQESPGAIQVFDSGFTAMIGLIRLDYGPIVGHQLQAERSGYGEGLVLLRNGHVLIAMEKNPGVIVEFGPIGDDPIGFNRETVLTSEERFSLPQDPHSTYVPLHRWKIDGSGRCDLSELTVTAKKELVLLSEECRSVSWLRDLLPERESAIVDRKYLVPPGIAKPEGLVVLSDNLVFIGSDKGIAKKGENVFVLSVPAKAELRD